MGRPGEPVMSERVHRPWTGGLLALGLLALMVVGLASLPREDADLPLIAQQALALALPDWKTTEVVNEVVYGTRAFDTFGETFLLLAAVVSAVVMTRPQEARSGPFGESRAGRQEQREDDPPSSKHEDREEREAREGERLETRVDDPSGADHEREADRGPLSRTLPQRTTAMSAVVRTGIRVALPVLWVSGFYLVLQGYTPGGGFPAGLVLMGVVLMIYAGFGYPVVAPLTKRGRLETAELLGALVVITVLGLGLPLAGSMTANWLPLAPEETLRSGGTMQVFSVAEFVEVATGLLVVGFALFAMRHDWAPDPDDHGADEDDEDDEDGAA